MHRSHTPASGGTQTATEEPGLGSKNETITAAKDARAGDEGTLSAELTSSTKGFVEGPSMGEMYEVEASRSRSRTGGDGGQEIRSRDDRSAHAQTTSAEGFKERHIHGGCIRPLSAAYAG
jgi:hypothetical protein